MSDTDFDAIPEELKQRDQWLLWDSSHDTPRRPHWRGDFQVSWSDPDAWHTFEEAVEAASDIESWGIGYVTAADNPDYARGLYGVIDLDGCATEEQRAKDWVPSLQPFVDRDAYVEWSPSGTGLHIPVVGIEVPDWWTDTHLTEQEHEGVDVLTHKFCTFTGDTETLSGDAVAECGDWLDEWLREVQKSLTGEDPVTGTADGDATTNTEEWLTKDDVREALDYIDPDVGYPTWRDIGFALADHLDDSTALSLFEDWSRSGSKWDTDAERQAERIIKDSREGGGRTIGTVIHHAREGGWEMPNPSASIGGSADDETKTETPDVDPESVTTWAEVRDMYDMASEQMPDKHARQAAAAKLIDEHDYATPFDTEKIWIYNEDTGIYELEGQANIEMELAKNLGAHYSQHEMREIVGKIRAQSYINRDEFDAGEIDHLLCVENGVLDLEERELLDHSPKYYFTRGLEVEYDPDATADNVERFLSDITRRDEDKQTIIEMIGHGLWPRYEPNKFLIMFGEGANGKSTFFEMVEALFGTGNVAGWELQKLSENRFAAADLVDKFANIAPDMPGTQINELGTLKTLTGEDQTMAERKGEQGFEFVNRATLMFGANRPPAIPEASTAIKRRLVPVHLPYEFTSKDDENPDARDRAELLAELTTEEELSGLLNLALDGLERLREQGDVSLPETHEERLEYYEQFSDPIKQFRIHALTNERGTRETKSAIYNAYKEFARQNDYAIKDKRVFYRVLRQTTLVYDESRPEIDGERVRVLNDVKFTPTGLDYAPEGSLIETREERERNATELSGVADGDEGLTVEGRVVDVENDNPDAMAQKLRFADETDTVDVVVWDDANKPALEEGECYRLKQVRAEVHEGTLNLNVSQQSGIEEIQAGAGNAPAADAGDNKRLGTTADGGIEIIDKRGKIMNYVAENQPVVIPEIAGATGLPPADVSETVEKMLTEKDLRKEPEGYVTY